MSDGLGLRNDYVCDCLFSSDDDEHGQPPESIGRKMLPIIILQRRNRHLWRNGREDRKNSVF